MANNVNWSSYKAPPNTFVNSGVYNKLVDEIRALVICDSPDYRINKNTGGTKLNIIFPPQAQSTGGSTESCPFDMTVRTVSGSLFVSFSPGTVNSILPSNIFSGLTGSYTSGSTQYVYNSNTTDGKTITSTTLTLSSDAPTQQTATMWTAPSAFTYLVGVVVDKTPYKTISCGNLNFAPTIAITIPKSSISPNTIPFDNYYVWQPSNGSG
jgi:hypothetical protein